MALLFALSKGRILQESLPLLQAIGLEPTENIADSRKLILNSNRAGINLALLRAQDVISYVDSGAADLGIAGYDLICEQRPENIYAMLDLGIARCQLMTARPKRAHPGKKGLLRVATKYPRLASEFYASRGQQIQPIKLYGSMELAPILNIADEIVDVVSTGNTLKANNLVAGLSIMPVSSYLVVNKNALKTKYQELQPLIAALDAQLQQ